MGGSGRGAGDAEARWRQRSANYELGKSGSGGGGFRAEWWSRSRKDASHLYGESMEDVLCECVREDVTSLLLDGEMMVVDLETGRYLPFGENRSLKDFGTSMRHCFVAFDLLLYNGRSMTGATLAERSELLRRAVRTKQHALTLIERFEVGERGAGATTAVMRQLDVMMSRGLEGVVFKSLSSKYDPGSRDKSWIKLKPDFVDGMGDTRSTCSSAITPVCPCDSYLSFSGWGDMGRCGESPMRPVSQPMGRCGEMWGDVGRCLLFARGSDKLPPSGASLSSRLTPSALSGDTLDLLILGGYYGEGRRRSGAVSTFLMGVRAPPEAAKRVGGAAHPLFYPFCKVGTGYSLPQLRELRERLMPASLTRRRGNALGHGASLTAVSCEQVSHEWKNSRRPAHLCHWEPSKVRVPPAHSAASLLPARSGS